MAKDETGEAVHDKENMRAVAVVAEGSLVKTAMVGDVEYDIVQAVNLPTLTHDTGVTVGIRIDEKMVEDTNSEGKPLFVMRITELSSGQQFNYVCNAVTEGNLHQAYPDDGYVGKCFLIRKGGIVAGKRYKDVEIIEIRAR